MGGNKSLFIFYLFIYFSPQIQIGQTSPFTFVEDRKILKGYQKAKLA
jgi:hypothetical protein